MSICKRLPACLFASQLLVSCGEASSDPSGGGSSEASGGASSGEIGEPENLYIAAVETLTQGLDEASCALMTTLGEDYETYYPAMTSEQYRTWASTRFAPVVEYMSRKLCDEWEIAGDHAAYERDALADSPAGDFLDETPLLQAIVDQSADLEELLDAANVERNAQGLEPIIVADYPNSIVGGPTSTIVFFPGWPDRPELDQWLQVQRFVGQLFFISLEPRDDGGYATYVHGRSMTTTNGKTTVGTKLENGTCLQCHYSGKPIHMRALDDEDEAAKVATLLEYLVAYPAATSHPEYNPFPGSPGIGTGGRLTLEEATTYAGRSITTEELDTLNENTSCDSCHNDTYQNALRPPFGETVEILMANGIMPPGSGIVDASARAEAIKVMSAAYRVKLKQYLLGE